MTSAAPSPALTPACFSHRSLAGRWLRAGLALLLLAGCQQDGGRHLLLGQVSGLHNSVTPAALTTLCDDIWQRDDDDDVVNKADYWLSAMECASRMSPTKARAEADHHGGDRWQESFRQSILLNVAGISVAERRQSYQQLLQYRNSFPVGVYPLFKLWHQQQALRLIAADERSRAQRQQEDSLAQINEMAAREQQLRQELEITTRKLQNLTEIERRLSSRKLQAPEEDVPAAGGQGNAPGSAAGRSPPRQPAMDEGR